MLTPEAAYENYIQARRNKNQAVEEYQSYREALDLKESNQAVNKQGDNQDCSYEPLEWYSEYSK